MDSTQRAPGCDSHLSFFLFYYDQLLLFKSISAPFMMHAQTNVLHSHSESKLSSSNATRSFLLRASEKRLSILHITELFVLALFILLSLLDRIKILLHQCYLGSNQSTSLIYINFPGVRHFEAQSENKSNFNF